MRNSEKWGWEACLRNNKEPSGGLAPSRVSTEDHHSQSNGLTPGLGCRLQKGPVLGVCIHLGAASKRSRPVVKSQPSLRKANLTTARTTGWRRRGGTRVFGELRPREEVERGCSFDRDCGDGVNRT